MAQQTLRRGGVQEFKLAENRFKGEHTPDRLSQEPFDVLAVPLGRPKRAARPPDRTEDPNIVAGLLTDLADRRVLGSFTLLEMALGKDPLVGPGEVQDETATLRESDGPGRLVEDLRAGVREDPLDCRSRSVPHRGDRVRVVQVRPPCWGNKKALGLRCSPRAISPSRAVQVRTQGTSAGTIADEHEVRSERWGRQSFDRGSADPQPDRRRAPKARYYCAWPR